MGEVGKALRNVLRSYEPIGIDINDEEHCWDDVGLEVEILHICFPYSTNFIKDVQNYQKSFKPKFTVIHSTVPVGTSSKLQAIHSPIRGIHPSLEEGIRTFPKFLGGEQAGLVADYFRQAGLKVILYDRSETTEALKLFDTEYYRACIEFAQRVKKYCSENDLNFTEVYTLPNQTYNEGYKELGHPEFQRPVLQPIMTPIGGHCVVPNSKLIKEEV